MKHSIYTSYDDLPLMLSVAEVAAVLGISRAGTYFCAPTMRLTKTVSPFGAVKETAMGSRVPAGPQSLRERPSETPRVSACEPLCALLLAKASVYPLSSAKANVSRLCRRCWKRWYDCISYAFRSFFEDEKESRIKGWRRNRRSARSLLPAVRAVDGGFNAGGCGVYFRKSQNGWRLCSRKRRCFNENKRALRQIGGNDEQK